MKNLALIFSAFLITISLQGQDIAGDWNGVLKVQGMQLRLVFHITKADNGYASTLDSPDQGALGIPVTSTELDGTAITLKVDPLRIVYSGIINTENEIEGTFTQSGQSFPMNLTQTPIEKSEPKRPQEPKPPFPYKSEDVKLPSLDGSFELAGTLTLPRDKSDYPVVILISGSGPQNRDEELLGHKPFLVLSDHLTRNGIGVLRYDDRGVAESGGDRQNATSLDFANDVQAVVNFLKKRKDIGKNPIGLIGHSEGGLIAPMVASKSKDVDFIVLMAGPGVPGDQIIIEQTGLILKSAGNSEERIQSELNLSRGAFDIIKSSQNPDSIKSDLLSYFSESMKDAPLPEGTSIEEFLEPQLAQLTSPWFQYFLSYDPTTSLSKVQCPVLAINGEKDLQVPPNNLQLIHAALVKGGNKNVTVSEFPGLNHLFQTSETGAVNEYATIEETMAPVVLKRITDWILALR